ncbi:MAG TPA: alpha/beta hydrolase [Thermomicrobiales bacterium]|nr:alpha/beta hydrolase [Thermomicrobiales bacterium]
MTTALPATVPTVVLESAAQALADALTAGGGPPLYTLTPQEARAVLDGAQAGTIPMAPAMIEERIVPGGPGGQVLITTVRPVGMAHVLPGVIYIHGGGWVLGNFATHERLVRELAEQTGAVYIFVNYTPSPEAQYPVAIEEAYAALTWVAEHGAEIGVDPSRLAIAGDSVGGNMTAAVALLANERGGPALRLQALFYPVTNAAFTTDSYDQFADGPWLTRKAMQWFWDLYAPDLARRMEPTASPLLASLEQLAGLPPALVITDEADVLRDEGEAYSRKLRQAGVDVTAVRYEGIFHDFMMLNALAETNATQAATAQAALAMKAALVP